MNERRVFSVSRAAGLVECPAQWLRDRDEILQPIKDDAGRRVYTQAHIEQARELRAARDARRHADGSRV